MSVTKILHINAIQCHSILMKHLTSFVWMTILIYSILKLGYYIFSPLWLHSTLVISSCTIWLQVETVELFFLTYLFIYSFLTAGRRVKTKNELKTVDWLWNLCSLWIKLIRSRRLDIDLGLFLRFYGPRLCLGPWKGNKRTRPISSRLDLTLGQYNIWIYFMQTHTHLAGEDSTKNHCASEPGICLTNRSVDFLS